MSRIEFCGPSGGRSGGLYHLQICRAPHPIHPTFPFVSRHARQNPTRRPAPKSRGARTSPKRRKKELDRTLPPRPDPGAQLSSLVEHSNDAIFCRTFDGIVTTWNAAATRIFGYTAREILGKSSRMLQPPGTEDEFRLLSARLRQGQVVKHFETERRRKDGQRIRVSLTLSLIRNPSRRPIGISTIARDITVERQLHDELSRRERELNDFFEGASVGLALVAPNGTLLRANRAFASMLDARNHQLVGTKLHSFHCDLPALDELLKRLRRHETLHNHPMELRSLKGETRHVLVEVDGRWERGAFLHSRWFVRDISRRRQLERELLESTEREQRRIAQELHDGLGQQLGGVAYLSSVLRDRLAERKAPETEAAARIFNLVRKAIEDTRRTARGLSPIRDDPEALMVALRELAAQTADIHHLRCRVVCPRPVLIPQVTIGGHLFRIAQEAVSNAVRHGTPNRITLSLLVAHGHLALAILDDGKGIDPLLPNREGLGLRIMQYRAGLIRGTIEVSQRPRHGTRVLCLVPWPPLPPQIR